MYICKECGKVFGDDEIAVWEESRGEYWGQPCTEKMRGCPNCNGDFTEAKKCEICGDWIDKDGWDACDECLEKYMTAETCLEIGKEYAVDVKLNDFILFNFSVNEIEDILLEVLQNNKEKLEKSVKDYCEYDMSYFADWAVKRWKEEK